MLSVKLKPVELVVAAAPAAAVPNPNPTVPAPAGALVATLPGAAPNGVAAAGALDRPNDGVMAEVLAVEPNDRPVDAVVAGAGPAAARRPLSVGAEVVTAVDVAGPTAGDPIKADVRKTFTLNDTKAKCQHH